MENNEIMNANTETNAVTETAQKTSGDGFFVGLGFSVGMALLIGTVKGAKFLYGKWKTYKAVKTEEKAAETADAEPDSSEDQEDSDK